MTIEDFLDKMEQLILEAGRVPFTNKRVIEEDDLVTLLDALRRDVPNEIQDAQNIVKERNHILAEAEEEAKKIVEMAHNRADSLINDHIIAKKAQESAKDLMDATKKEREALRSDAFEYADAVFSQLDQNLNTALQTIRQAHVELKKIK
ncbi:ATP synthase subunit B family protein [Anaerosinus gibii]|uniref:ATPase n=1 Tax=Selenobaculum gibii TaxID=3054208 RepID=A0A9Y2AGU2_9FIRM|nr:ATP synthase F0 subunit B [Selenobaculum gbiensis]WIW69607.1 ATPase [Selenobaculum gbiensis]